MYELRLQTRSKLYFSWHCGTDLEAGLTAVIHHFRCYWRHPQPARFIFSPVCYKQAFSHITAKINWCSSYAQGHLTPRSIQSCFETLTQAEEIYKHTLTQRKFVSCWSIKYWAITTHWISQWDTVWNNHFRNLCRNALSCLTAVFGF